MGVAALQHHFWHVAMYTAILLGKVHTAFAVACRAVVVAFCHIGRGFVFLAILHVIAPF